MASLKEKFALHIDLGSIKVFSNIVAVTSKPGLCMMSHSIPVL